MVFVSMSDTPLPDISHDQHAVRRNKLAEMRAEQRDQWMDEARAEHEAMGFVQGWEACAAQLAELCEAR